MFENFFKYRVYEKVIFLASIYALGYWSLRVDQRAIWLVLFYSLMFLRHVKKEAKNDE